MCIRIVFRSRLFGNTIDPIQDQIANRFVFHLQSLDSLHQTNSQFNSLDNYSAVDVSG